MQKDSGEKLAELRVDGGAAANDLLMQFQATCSAFPSSGRASWRPPPWAPPTSRPYRGSLEIARRARAALAGPAPLRTPDRSSDRETRMSRWREAVSRARNWHNARGSGYCEVECGLGGRCRLRRGSFRLSRPGERKAMSASSSALGCAKPIARAAGR